MDEDVDRRARLFRAIEIQPLDVGAAVAVPLGRADALSHQLARIGEPREDLVAIGRVDRLVVRVIERLLVVVEEYLRHKIRFYGDRRESFGRALFLLPALALSALAALGRGKARREFPHAEPEHGRRVPARSLMHAGARL